MAADTSPSEKRVGSPKNKKSATRSKVGQRTRAEKTEETRRRLLHAASALIGDEGYARATIAKITSRADLSLGTFYTYFRNREDLFDQLLPQMGDELLSFVGKRITGITDPLAHEEAGLQAFFDFIGENPGFYRLLNEAETAVPAAYHRHFRNISERYIRALDRHKRAGGLRGYDSEEGGVSKSCWFALCSDASVRYAEASEAPGDPPCPASIPPNSAACLPA